MCTILQKKDRDKFAQKTKQQQGTQYIKRVIVHPHFHNISYKEAEKLLREQDQGDVIIRYNIYFVDCSVEFITS